MKLSIFREYISLKLLSLLGLVLFFLYMWWALLIFTPVDREMSFFVDYGIFQQILGYIFCFHLPVTFILFCAFFIEKKSIKKTFPKSETSLSNNFLLILFFFGLFISITPYILLILSSIISWFI